MFTSKNLKYTKYTNLEFKVVTKLSISTFLLFRRENVSNNPKWFNIVQDNLRIQKYRWSIYTFQGKIYNLHIYLFNGKHSLNIYVHACINLIFWFPVRKGLKISNQKFNLINA